MLSLRAAALSGLGQGDFSMHGGIAVELKCKAKIMDAAAIDRTLVRIAHEILERTTARRICA